MKSIFRILALCAVLISLWACALADDVPVYWQLERVLVETAAQSSYGPASAQTNAVSLETTDVREMIEAIRSEGTAALSVSRASRDRHANAAYTFSGVPALVPGAASARLTLTAQTQADEDSFYGFLAGILAGNYDISVIYVDAFLKLVKAEAGELVDFFAKLEKLVANAGCDMIISFSEDAAIVPESIRKYQI